MQKYIIKLVQKLYIRTHMYMYSFDILTCKIHFTDTQYTNTLINVPSPLRLLVSSVIILIQFNNNNKNNNNIAIETMITNIILFHI